MPQRPLSRQTLIKRQTTLPQWDDTLEEATGYTGVEPVQQWSAQPLKFLDDYVRGSNHPREFWSGVGSDPSIVESWGKSRHRVDPEGKYLAVGVRGSAPEGDLPASGPARPRRGQAGYPQDMGVRVISREQMAGMDPNRIVVMPRTVQKAHSLVKQNPQEPSFETRQVEEVPDTDENEFIDVGTGVATGPDQCCVDAMHEWSEYIASDAVNTGVPMTAKMVFQVTEGQGCDQFRAMLEHLAGSPLSERVVQQFTAEEARRTGVSALTENTPRAIIERWDVCSGKQLSADDPMFTAGHGSAGILVKHAESPEAKRHKSEYDTAHEKSPERVKYRVGLNRERHKRGIYGRGGPDMSHTKRGTLVAESPHLNRARHFRERGTLKGQVRLVHKSEPAQRNPEARHHTQQRLLSMMMGHEETPDHPTVQGAIDELRKHLDHMQGWCNVSNQDEIDNCWNKKFARKLEEDIPPRHRGGLWSEIGKRHAPMPQYIHDAVHGKPLSAESALNLGYTKPLGPEDLAVYMWDERAYEGEQDVNRICSQWIDMPNYNDLMTEADARSAQVSKMSEEEAWALEEQMLVHKSDEPWDALVEGVPGLGAEGTPPMYRLTSEGTKPRFRTEEYEKDKAFYDTQQDMVNIGPKHVWRRAMGLAGKQEAQGDVDFGATPEFGTPEVPRMMNARRAKQAEEAERIFVEEPGKDFSRLSAHEFGHAVTNPEVQEFLDTLTGQQYRDDPAATFATEYPAYQMQFPESSYLAAKGAMTQVIEQVAMQAGRASQRARAKEPGVLAPIEDIFGGAAQHQRERTTTDLPKHLQALRHVITQADRAGSTLAEKEQAFREMMGARARDPMLRGQILTPQQWPKRIKTARGKVKVRGTNLP